MAVAREGKSEEERRKRAGEKKYKKTCSFMRREVARLIPRRFPCSRARERCIKERGVARGKWGKTAGGEEEATNREYSVFKRRWGWWAFYESRVRAVAIAVLMPCNSSRLFTVINKGEPGKRAGISGKCAAHRPSVSPSVRPSVRTSTEKSRRDCDRIQRFMMPDVIREDFAHGNVLLMLYITTEMWKPEIYIYLL